MLITGWVPIMRVVLPTKRKVAMPDLAIVIVNYNTQELLRACIESILREQGNLAVEIIVVDNDSRDGSADMLREHFSETVRLIETGRNTWFSGGNNIGVKAAQSDTVLILNADTIMQPQTLQILFDYLHENDQVGAVTCQQRFPDTNAIIRTCSEQTTYSDLLLGYTFLGVIFSGQRAQSRQHMWYDSWNRQSNRSIGIAPGSCIMASRELLLSFGVFDEALKLYFTDDDLCRDILATGKEIHFVAEAILLHYEHASVEQVQRLASQIYFDDLVTFCRKHHGTARALLLQVLMIPTRWGMAAAQRLRGERKTIQVAQDGS